MNRSITLGTFLVILLVVAFLASSGLAVNYYRTATLVSARAAALEDKSKALADQLAQANKALQDAQVQLHDALGRLGLTEEQLKATRGELGKAQTQLSQAQEESQRRLQVIFAQQDNVNALKTCLAGVVLSHDYYRKGIDCYVAWNDNPNDYDFQEALRNFKMASSLMDPVKDDCDKAYALFK
jgi:Tfp pilus assembly protein PilX